MQLPALIGEAILFGKEWWMQRLMAVQDAKNKHRWVLILKQAF